MTHFVTQLLQSSDLSLPTALTQSMRPTAVTASHPAEGSLRLLKPPRPPIRIPSVLGPYRLQRMLGRGGTAIVFLALRPGASFLERSVALKVMPTQSPDRPSHHDLLMRQASVENALRHPGIVDVYDVGQDSDFAYCAMEWVDGLTLKQALKRQGPLPPHLVVEIGLALCEVLDYIHGTGTHSPPFTAIHGDIKPSNVLIDRFGRVKLIDFGIATVDYTHHPQQSVGFGTAAYMSPEQVMRISLDGRSDLYSMGVLLYELMTGERLFPGRDVALLMQQHLSKPTRLQTTMARWLRQCFHTTLEGIVSRCTEPQRDARYATAQELKTDLLRLKSRLKTGPTLMDWSRELTSDPELDTCQARAALG